MPVSENQKTDTSHLFPVQAWFLSVEGQAEHFRTHDRTTPSYCWLHRRYNWEGHNDAHRTDSDTRIATQNWQLGASPQIRLRGVSPTQGKRCTVRAAYTWIATQNWLQSWHPPWMSLIQGKHRRDRAVILNKKRASITGKTGLQPRTMTNYHTLASDCESECKYCAIWCVGVSILTKERASTTPLDHLLAAVVNVDASECQYLPKRERQRQA